MSRLSSPNIRLGAINQNKDPVELNPHNVDFDVSYVDTAFLPAAMVPFNTTLPPIAQVGYVGTPQPIDTFRAALNKFVAADSPYRGWPQFIDNQGNTILKLPSVLHITAGDPDMTPKPWPPVDKLRTNWNGCLPDNPSAICQDIRAVRQLFLDNYKNYREIFPAKCDPGKQPIELTEDLVISHVYGFAPFGENCPSATVNLLENTPGYAADNSEKFHQIKDLFDGLQYWKTGEFDPYVSLIHGADYVNAPNVYAYSVDDAVGNLQADATGFIIAVGGTRGLPNPNPAAPPVNVNFGYAKTDKVRFEKYGICTTTPDQAIDPDYASFGLSVLSQNLGQCPLSLIDNNGALYTLKLKSGPPYPYENAFGPNTHAPIDCSGNTPGTPGRLVQRDIRPFAEAGRAGAGPEFRDHACSATAIAGCPPRPVTWRLIDGDTAASAAVRQVVTDVPAVQPRMRRVIPADRLLGRVARRFVRDMRRARLAARGLPQRLENWNERRALALPYFLRSTTRGSRVRKPPFLSAPRRSGSK